MFILNVEVRKEESHGHLIWWHNVVIDRQITSGQAQDFQTSITHCDDVTIGYAPIAPNEEIPDADGAIAAHYIFTFAAKCDLSAWLHRLAADLFTQSTPTPQKQLTIVVEGADDDQPQVTLSTSRAMMPSEYPGNDRFVVGRNSRNWGELLVVDRISRRYVAKALMCVKPTKQTRTQLKITKLFVKMCEEIYQSDRAEPAKQILVERIGKAIEVVGEACLY